MPKLKNSSSTFWVIFIHFLVKLKLLTAKYCKILAISRFFSAQIFWNFSRQIEVVITWKRFCSWKFLEVWSRFALKSAMLVVKTTSSGPALFKSSRMSSVDGGFGNVSSGFEDFFKPNMSMLDHDYRKILGIFLVKLKLLTAKYCKILAISRFFLAK